jgi:membrane-bound lytic murein transglycosylase A
VAETPATEEVAVETPREATVRTSVSGPALMLVGRDPQSDVDVAVRSNRATLIESLGQSLDWFEKPSSQEHFPTAGVTHEHARASVYAFRWLVEHLEDDDQLAEQIERQFDFFSSVGSNGDGDVLFTGYYAPVFEASRTRGGPYQYPLYTLPYDLVKDSATGETLGQEIGGEVRPYPTRAVIETSGMLEGSELVWLSDPFEAYLVHIQGSAALALPDGRTMMVGYAGNNGHDYVSVSLQLVGDGKIREDELSLEEVRAYLESHPDEMATYLRRNKRFIFFREVNSGSWPEGNLGVKVTGLRSLATDKTVFPPGGVTLVVTSVPDGSGGFRRMSQFMLDQDSGGAIRSPGRADIFYGVGGQAEELAGGQYSEGRLYYLFLSEERLDVWRDKIPPLP